MFIKKEKIFLIDFIIMIIFLISFLLIILFRKTDYLFDPLSDYNFILYIALLYILSKCLFGLVVIVKNIIKTKYFKIKDYKNNLLLPSKIVSIIILLHEIYKILIYYYFIDIFNIIISIIFVIGLPYYMKNELLINNNENNNLFKIYCFILPINTIILYLLIICYYLYF